MSGPSSWEEAARCSLALSLCCYYCVLGVLFPASFLPKVTGSD